MRLFPSSVVVSCVVVVSFFNLSAIAQAPLAETTLLIEAANSILNSPDKSKLTKLAIKPQDFAWINHRTRPGDTNWQAHLLESNKANEFFAIFSAYHSTQSIGDHLHSMVKAESGWKFGSEISETETMGFRVRDHQFAVQFNLKAKTAYLTDEVQIERTAAKSGPFVLRLSSVFHVDSLKFAGKNITFAAAPGIILIDSPSDNRFTLSIEYHGALDKSSMDSYIGEREVFMNSYWYPHISRLPAKYGVRVTVPKGWTAIAQGEEVSREELPNTTVFAYRCELPVSYFSLDAGPYVISKRTVKGKTLAVCMLEQNNSTVQRALTELERAIFGFEKLFGSTPFTHYEVVQTKGTFGGALEAYSFSTYAGDNFGLVTHEVAHTWWGGIIPNTYTRTLWNESFANYSEALLDRQLATKPPAKALTGRHKSQELGREMLTQFSVSVMEAFDTENAIHSAVGYDKGAFVLDMLEDLIGVQKMLASLRKFRADHPSGEPGEWPEYERAVTADTGQDLRWFFEQWLEREGVPVVRMTNVHKRKSGSAWQVTADIVQTGKPYRLPLILEITLSDGRKSRSQLTAKNAVTTVKIDCKGIPVRIELDPEGNILMAGAKTEIGVEPFKTEIK